MDLFKISTQKLQSLERTAFELEREIQGLLKATLGEVFGIRFLATEFSTGDKHPGRIDSLGPAVAELSPRPSLPRRRHGHSLGQNMAKGGAGP